MEEWIVVIFVFGIALGSCAGCTVGHDDEAKNNRQKQIELNLAHYNQKSGKYVQDSLSCVNDSCVIIRKNGE